jgi:hypothetical protein
MKTKFTLLFALAVCAVMFAQIPAGVRTNDIRLQQIGLIADLPATCTAGQIYVATDGARGRKLRECGPNNTWSIVAYGQGTAFPASCSLGELFFKENSTAGENLHLCTTSGTPGTWTQIAGGGTGSGFYQTMLGSGPFGSEPKNTSRTQRSSLQARDNLEFGDDGTNTILNFTPLDAGVVWIDEEFFNANTTSGAIGTYSWHITQSGTNAQVQYAAGWPNLGVIRASTGTVQGNFASYHLGQFSNGPNLGALGSNTNWGYMWVFGIGSNQNIRFRAGVTGGNPNAIDPVSTIGIRFDTVASDSNFTFFVKPASGSVAPYNTGVVADTAYHTLLVYSTTAGKIHMSLDGGTERTFCAAGGGCDVEVTVPTAVMMPFFQCGTDTTASKTCDMDAFKFKAVVSTGTTNKRN